MKFRKLILSAAVLGSIAVPVATAHAASPPAAPKATGGITLLPAQSLSFSAITGTPAKGNVDYANADTQLWDARTLTNVVVLGTYSHALSITTFTPTTSHSATFSGTGFYGGDPSTTGDDIYETVSGTINGNAVTYSLTYTGSSYIYSATGTINPADGSASGTGTSNIGQQDLTWTAPAGSFTPYVLAYTAPVTCAVVSGTDATFGYTIPTTAATTAWGIAGLPIVWSVHDGGTPGTAGDTAGFTTGTTTCPAPGTAPANSYAITGGNLVVH